MEKLKLISIIENGKQVGINKIIKVEHTEYLYTYAIQKIRDNYITYTNEINMDRFYADELENDTEVICIYHSLEDFLSDFSNKYDIIFEDFHVSKGNKFFNPDFYL